MSDAETAPTKLMLTRAHQTYRNAAGAKVPGVTTVLGMLAKPALIHWAWSCGKDGLDYDAVSGRAKNVGTVAHALIEAHLHGEAVDLSEVAPAVALQAQDGRTRFQEWWDAQGLTLIAAEHQMVSERMQVGGTADFIAQRPDGTSVLGDVKTSSRIYDEHCIQAAVYAAMAEELGGAPIDEVLVVRVGKEPGDQIEVRDVSNRAARVAAFQKLAEAREALWATGFRL